MEGTYANAREHSSSSYGEGLPTNTSLVKRAGFDMPIVRQRTIEVHVYEVESDLTHWVTARNDDERIIWRDEFKLGLSQGVCIDRQVVFVDMLFCSCVRIRLCLRFTRGQKLSKHQRKTTETNIEQDRPGQGDWAVFNFLYRIEGMFISSLSLMMIYISTK